MLLTVILPELLYAVVVKLTLNPTSLDSSSNFRFDKCLSYLFFHWSITLTSIRYYCLHLDPLVNYKIIQGFQSLYTCISILYLMLAKLQYRIFPHLFWRSIHCFLTLCRDANPEDTMQLTVYYRAKKIYIW